jgi:ATP-dependent Clp protease ATP-binding subunit ClpC
VFERFTEPARIVVVVAQEEARRLQHNYIGTEHLLMGLLREEEGVAAQVLASLGVTEELARAQIVRVIGSGDEASLGQIPFTPRAKDVLELSLRESLGLGDDYIGTEHILLGLVAEGEGVAMRVLQDLGVDGRTVRDAVTDGLFSPDTSQAKLRQAAARAVERATEIAAAAGRPVDASDLIVALAEGDEIAREVLGQYVSLEELQQRLEEARRRRD